MNARSIDPTKPVVKILAGNRYLAMTDRTMAVRMGVIANTEDAAKSGLAVLVGKYLREREDELAKQSAH